MWQFPYYRLVPLNSIFTKIVNNPPPYPAYKRPMRLEG